MARNVNMVALTGNLTRDPELRAAGSTSVCSLGLAVNESYKDRNTGEFKEYTNFFEIEVWGAQGDACAQYLAKGRPIAVQGRLRFESWTDQTSQTKRSKVKVVASLVQFLGQGGGGGGRDFDPTGGEGQQQMYGTGGQQGGGGDWTATATDDDIPFVFLDDYSLDARCPGEHEHHA